MAEGNTNAPNFEQTPQLELSEDQGQHETTSSQEAALESDNKAVESSTGKQAPQLFVPSQTTAVVVQDDDSGQSPQANATDDPAFAGLPAKDADLIEKEWVQRAKSIISKTADDPHKQKDEVSQMKAAYIQKRFNKVIKTDEAAA